MLDPKWQGVMYFKNPNPHLPFMTEGKIYRIIRKSRNRVKFINDIGHELWDDLNLFTPSSAPKEEDFVSEEVDEDGTIRRYNSKHELHSLHSPAAEYPSGDKYWYHHGKHHRIDGPAITYADGYKAWYQNGEYHREDGPAIELPNGVVEWYYHNMHHCMNGPAIVYKNGDKEWWINGACIGKSDNGFTDEDFENYKKPQGNPQVIVSSEKNIMFQDITYRQWLIGQALASCSAMSYVVPRDPQMTNEEILQGCAEYAIRCADIIIAKSTK